MHKLFLLGNSSTPSRATNTVQHANDLWLDKTSCYQLCSSNKHAVESLLRSETPNWLALIPFYNVFWSSVKDTLEWIGNSMSQLKILAVTKMRIEYWLVCKKWTSIGNIQDIWTHVQSFHQTSNSQTAMFWKKMNHINTGSTAWAIEYIHAQKNSPKLDSYAWVIAPHQYIPSIDDESVDVLSNEFWPKDNFTYFLLMGWNNSEYSENLVPSSALSDDVGCEIMNIPDEQGSLHRKLVELCDSGISILGIVSIKKWIEDEMEFIYTYTKKRDHYDNNLEDLDPLNYWFKLLSANEDNSEFTWIIKIPQKSGTLKNAIGLFHNLWFDIRELYSTPTWYKTVDFFVKFRNTEQNDNINDRIYQLWSSINSQSRLSIKSNRKYLGD